MRRKPRLSTLARMCIARTAFEVMPRYPGPQAIGSIALRVVKHPISPSRISVEAALRSVATSCRNLEHTTFSSSAPAALQKGTAAPFSVLMVDGVVGGLWQRRREGKVLRVQVEAFGQLSQQQRTQLAGQVSRIGEILEFVSDVVQELGSEREIGYVQRILQVRGRR